MSEQAKRAEEVWDKADTAYCDSFTSPEDTIAAVAVIAAALQEAERRGYLRGLAAARESFDRGHGRLLKEETDGK